MSRRVTPGNISDPRLILLFIAFASFAFIVAAALTAVLYAPPIILICGVLYNELKGHQRQTSLSSEETVELSDVEESLRNARERLAEIETEGAHLKRNKDGSYHRGSKLGMSLNGELDELIPLEEDLSTRAEALRFKPLHMLDSWINAESIRFAFRWTLIVYVFIVLSLYILKPGKVVELSAFVRQHTLVHVSAFDIGFYGDALISAASSVLLFALLYPGRRFTLRNATKNERQRLDDFAGEGDAASLAYESDDQFAEEQGDQSVDDDDESDEDRPQRGRRGYNRSAKSNDSPDQETCYETLGISPSATREEIDAAWRAKVKINHPDRVATLDTEFQALAEERTKRLNAAHQEALQRL